MGERPGICAVVACTRPRHSRGLCSLHYKRWWSGRPLTGPQRFADVVYACRTCGATWCRLPGAGAQPPWCSQECRLGVPRVVRPLAAGTLAVTAAVLVSVERGATHAGLARALGISIPRVEQHLATGRALLAGRPRDRLDEDAVLPLGRASRSIGVTPDGRAQAAHRSWRRSPRPTLEQPRTPCQRGTPAPA